MYSNGAFTMTYYDLSANVKNFGVVFSKIDAIYFNLATFATVGYGDITPKTQAARLLVSGNIVINITFITFAVTLFLNRTQKHILDSVARRGSERVQSAGMPKLKS